MLTYLLAWAVAFGSFGLYLSAFFFPELHRKNDLILSGLGLFFALTLWIYADRLRGGLLLGETAAVVLIFWFAWQSFKYRQQLTDPKLKTDDSQAQELWHAIKSVIPGQKSETNGVPTSKIAGQISDWVSKVDLDKLKGQFQGVIKKVPLPTSKSEPPTPAKINDSGEDFAETITTVVTETLDETDTEVIAVVESVVIEESVTVEPEAIPEPSIQSVVIEPEPTPEPSVAPATTESEPTPEPPIESVAIEPEPVSEASVESLTTEPEPVSEPSVEPESSPESVDLPQASQEIQAEVATTEELPHSDQESGHYNDPGSDGSPDDNWPPPGTQVGTEMSHDPHSI